MSTKNVILKDKNGNQLAPATIAEQVSYDATHNIKQALGLASGHATTANNAADMTDTTRIYVYTGSETGYTAGNWYYYDGSAWVSGGQYTDGVQFETDDTLSVSGKAADAAAVGELKDDLIYSELLNVFDGQLSNAYWNSSGVLISYNGDVCNTNKIPCKEGDIVKIITDPVISDVALFVSYFDSTGTTRVRRDTGTSTTYEGVAPTGASYVCFTFEKSGLTKDSFNSVKVYVNNLSDVLDEKLPLLENVNNAFSVALPWYGSGYIKSDGTIQGYTNFSYTDYIYVSGKVHLKANLYYVPSGYYHVGCYDSDHAFLGGLFEGTGGQQAIDQDLSLPDGTAYIRIATYTSQKDTVKLHIYNKVSDIAATTKVNTATITERISIEDLANNLFVSMPVNYEWYFETDDNFNIYVKAYPHLLVRGGWTASEAYTIAWSNIVTNLSQYIVTSPKGVINCLKLEDSRSLCLDIVGKTLVVKPTSNQRYPYFADIITNHNGRITKGQIDAYIGWTNYKSITELQMKLADVAYISDSMKTALIATNEEATYDYPNMPKILWISDVHWNNDCYAYLKYLADFGQYDALIISGDLNYYQFEQTLDATKTGMSELARLWNNYYRDKTIVLPCRGNHDGHVGYSDYTSEMFANAVIKPFQDCEPNGYYYYDIDKYKLRIIMLNSCDDAQSRKGFTSAEVTWFQNALASLQDGWSVISVSHHPIVQDINNETTLAGNSDAIVSAIQSFVSSKPNCNFIAHLSGHTHIDAMEKVNGVEYVSLIDSSTDQSDYSADIICINQTTQTVNLLRSGQGSDRQFTY